MPSNSNVTVEIAEKRTEINLNYIDTWTFTIIFSKNVFFCPWKGQAYQKQNTEGHYNLHAGFKDHTCEVCGHKFTLYRNLKQHFERYHDKK